MTKQKWTTVICLALLAVVAGLLTSSVAAQLNGSNGSTIDTSSSLSSEGLQLITSDLTVGFPLEAAVEDGAIRVLIPTATDSSKAIDEAGQAHEGVFTVPAVEDDGEGNKLPKVTAECPADAEGFDFSASPTESWVFYDPRTNTEYATEAEANTATEGKYLRYIAFTCSYTGTGARSGQFTSDSTTTDGTGTATRNIVIHGLINPSAPADLTLNKAVTIPAKIQLLNTGFTSAVQPGSLVSDYDVLISAIMQDIVVTATVEYQIMFRIEGIAKGATACGTTTSVGTTPFLIDYGAPTTGTFTDAAQRLYINSSVNNGYKVTLSENRQMKRQDSLRTASEDSGLCINNHGMVGSEINRDCIPHFDWKTGVLDLYTSKAWTSPTSTGLGYTVAAVTEEAEHNHPQVGIKDDDDFLKAGTYARLPTRVAGTDGTTAEEPTQIAYSESIADGDEYDVCYRLAIDSQNNAGVYDNEITYTITASL